MALGEYVGAGSGITKALYHLNGNANDSSGNSVNGTATNVTWTGGVLGNGSATFGTGAYITSSMSAHNTGDFTISLWANFAGTGDQILFGSSSANWGGLRYVSGTDMQLSVNGDGVTGGRQVTDPVTTGVWYNYTLTRSGDVYRLYKNGNQIMTKTISGVFSQGTLNISGVFNNGTVPFSGKQDEYIFDNVVWSPERVRRQHTFAKGRFGIL